MYKWIVLGSMVVLMWSCVPTKSEAATCRYPLIKYRSTGQCVTRAQAYKMGIIRAPRARKARVVHTTYVKPRRVTSERIPPATTVPSLNCDELCQLHINLHTWAQRNKGTF